MVLFLQVKLAKNMYNYNTLTLVFYILNSYFESAGNQISSRSSRYEQFLSFAGGAVPK